MIAALRGLTRLRRLSIMAALTGMWCVLWGEFSVANILSGLAISILVSLAGIDTPARGGVRIRPLIMLLWLVTVDLAKSTIDVAFEILTPTDYTEESVVEASLPFGSRKHFLFLIVAITLTPGTAVVDGDPDSDRLYLHLLHARRRDDTLAHVDRLADLVCRALPVKDSTSPELASPSDPTAPTEHPA